MKKGEFVTYIDNFGREHDALVFAVNPRDSQLASLVIIDVNAPENANTQLLYDIPHASHDTRQESNPELPVYTLHAWKEEGEKHLAMPTDHPAFDHPFKEPEYDEAGIRKEKERPDYAAQLAEHQASLPSMADLDAVAAEEEVKEATAPKKNGKKKWGDTSS
jgi:hypothetical protein